MKDVATQGMKIVSGKNVDNKSLNNLVKAVIINFNDARGDIAVTNDNFGTTEQHMDFTEGRKAAGLNPMQIVFSGVETEAMFDGRYMDKNDNICYFKDLLSK